MPNSRASGFAAKHNLTVGQLEREEQNGVEYLVATVVSPGKSAKEILAEAVPDLVARLPGDRLMRWGSSDFKFSRPIRWLVSLLDHEIVPLTINQVASDRKSYGHRILHGGEVSIEHAEKYIEVLEQAHVIVEPEKRRRMIETQVQETARKLGGQARQLGGALLEEVVNITEWPKAIAGDFAEEFLTLPGALIETVMVHHQRYFPVERIGPERDSKFSGNRLLPNFIAVVNNDREQAETEIRKGNERVLRARLADGRFFYFDDQKQKLSERANLLSQLTYHEELGSYRDKVHRMLRVTDRLAPEWELDAKLRVPLERTLELCKNDLVTNLVRELPELQGYVGAWYAEQEGQPPEVVQAIASHYSPRSTMDTIPGDTVGQLAAVIDKAETLTGLFCLGKRPSGSSDPYAMRRQAQGLVDILMQGLTNVPIHVSHLMRSLVTEYEPVVAKQKNYPGSEKVLGDLNEFLTARVRTNLMPIAERREIVDAVIASRSELELLPDMVTRCHCLNELIKSVEGIELIRAGARIGNILRSEPEPAINKSLLIEVAEKELCSSFESTFKISLGHASAGSLCADFVRQSSVLSSQAAYNEILRRLAAIVSPINAFFDNVMVNDEDTAKRNNRHALLSAIYKHFRLLADFSKLLPLAA
jgi:glycyl-tRNA synthetase beta chain